MKHALLLDDEGTVLWLDEPDDLHTAEQIVGHKVWELVPDEERESVRALLATVVFDNRTEHRVFSSRFAEARYSVEIQRLTNGCIVATVQRLLPASVTAREKEILCLISEDMKPQEIAKRLRLSTNTVDSYRRNLKQKLNVAGTAGLVKWAVRVGLTSP